MRLYASGPIATNPNPLPIGKEAGMTLPKGAGEQVDVCAAKLVEQGGRDLLSKYAKMHFRNSYKALGLPPPPKTEWKHH